MRFVYEGTSTHTGDPLLEELSHGLGSWFESVDYPPLHTHANCSEAKPPKGLNSEQANIELSRPAVRSPAATQFTFPFPTTSRPFQGRLQRLVMHINGLDRKPCLLS
jgi:hypothetical protein